MTVFLGSAVSGVPLLLALSFVSLAGAQEISPASAKTAGAQLGLDQILTKLEQHNAQRAAELQEFDGKRVYRMQYHGLFKDRDAEMVVKVHFSAPDSKQFTIVSQNGSKFVIDHVFKKLLEAEQDATGDKRRECALSRENYKFSLVGYETTPQGPQYVLALQPKSNNKYLYRGRIWVDAKEFAVVRILIREALVSSTRRTSISRRGKPSPDTETSIRFGGKSKLSIEYDDYKVVKGAALHITETARINRLALPVSASTPDE